MTMKMKILFLGLAVISMGVYLLLSASQIGVGFPLDDAWIHQSYARNLARSGEWAFVPGVPSVGATSFLWVLVLAAGYWLGLAPFVWTYVVGAGLLWALAMNGWELAKSLMPSDSRGPLWIALFLLFEWHLVWSSASGMETLIFGWLMTLALSRLFLLSKSQDARWWQGGLLIGVASLARPEGITLLAPFAIAVLLYVPEWKERFVAISHLLLAFMALFAPLLFFNFKMSGALWPNTFYAKQAEYSILLEIPFWQRFVNVAGLPLVGAGILLLPAFGIFLFSAINERKWAALLTTSWLVGFLSLYALRLPVTFQHGRYLIPMMPMFFILSLIGLINWLEIHSEITWRRVVSRVWWPALIVVHLAFWGLGAQAYTKDVTFIENEMVATAEWIQVNVPPDALIAAHDIGAIGYFVERPMLDLAGLISPEVIPFIRDEESLADYLNRSGADYLITFPDWYPLLSQEGQLIYQTEKSSNTGSELTEQNMAVFLWGEH
jgi:hypothetical protein